jgi:CHAT domain-containing protein
MRRLLATVAALAVGIPATAVDSICAGEPAKAQDEVDDFARRLEGQNAAPAGQVFDRAAIQAALSADAALVGWLDFASEAKKTDADGEHWAFVLRAKGEPVVVRLRGSGAGGRWAEADTRLSCDLRAALQSPSSHWRSLAGCLRKQRFDPLAGHLEAHDGLPAVRQLIVLPSAALAGVPAEAFADGFTVSYALSGTLFARHRNQPKPQTVGLLALADPAFGGGEDCKWKPPPGTLLEIEGLRKLFAGASVKPLVLTGSQASEQRLNDLARTGKLGRYRFLHLATHGSVDDRFPLRSAIILSRDLLPGHGKQLDAGLPVLDGRLTAEEVLRQWHLNAELVTLSGWQSGLGKYERGEGFVGFAQALLLAGSRSVCLSLWKVDDTATALLMVRFYENLLGKRERLKGPMGKAAALTEAKAWLRGLTRNEAMKRAAKMSDGVVRGPGPQLPAAVVPVAGGKEDRPYAHPYYWAAFVLIGDPD